jgi:hypothetical protein
MRKEVQATEVQSLAGYVTLEGWAEQIEDTRTAVYERVRRWGVPVILVGKTMMLKPAEYLAAGKRYEAELEQRRTQAWQANNQ